MLQDKQPKDLFMKMLRLLKQQNGRTFDMQRHLDEEDANANASGESS